jgi:uncharacterized protein with HEPN domain
MREAVKDRGRIEHMLFAINNVEEFTANISEEEFAESKILFYAVVKNIEIIGEASYMLTKEFKQSHSNIPWQIMEKMRHVLVHGYYTIFPKKVWETVQEDLPILKLQLTNLLAEI